MQNPRADQEMSPTIPDQASPRQAETSHFSDSRSDERQIDDNKSGPKEYVEPQNLHPAPSSGGAYEAAILENVGF